MTSFVASAAKSAASAAASQLPPPASAIWHATTDGANTRALAQDADGRLVGFALTGSAVAERMALLRTLAVA